MRLSIPTSSGPWAATNPPPPRPRTGTGRCVSEGMGAELATVVETISLSFSKAGPVSKFVCRYI